MIKALEAYNEAMRSHLRGQGSQQAAQEKYQELLRAICRDTPRPWTIPAPLREAEADFARARAELGQGKTNRAAVDKAYRKLLAISFACSHGSLEACLHHEDNLLLWSMSTPYDPEEK